MSNPHVRPSQILGIENVDAKQPSEALYAMCEHLAELFRLPMLRRARAVIIAESNLANEGDHLRLHLRNALAPAVSGGEPSSESFHAIPRVHVARLSSEMRSRVSFFTRGNGRVGVWTSQKSKAELAKLFAVRVERGLIAFHEHLVSHTASPAESKRELLRQLRAYECTVDLDARGELRSQTYSGKRNPPDDLSIAAQVLNYYGELHEAKGGVQCEISCF